VTARAKGTRRTGLLFSHSTENLIIFKDAPAVVKVYTDTITIHAALTHRVQCGERKCPERGRIGTRWEM